MTYGHHKETFITKYVFSQDHKMISKQYLITGLFMGIIGIAMSLLFRLQLAWPERQCHGTDAALGSAEQTEPGLPLVSASAGSHTVPDR